MRGARIPSGERIINNPSYPPLDPSDFSEANANHVMNLLDNLSTGEYIEDASILARHFSNLLCQEQSVPNLTVAVAAGSATFGTTFVAFAGGNSPSLTAPAANPRIDLICITSGGAITRTAGTEAASPVAPAVPANSIPLCSVYNVVGQTVIHDNDTQVAGQGYILSDLRPFIGIGATVIKSIQQGTIDVTIGSVNTVGSNGSNTATISSVDTTKAHVVFLGVYESTLPGGGSWVSLAGKVVLTDATTVTANVTAAAPSGGSPSIVARVGYVVVEYL